MTVEHSNTENTTALRIYYCGREQCAPGHFWGPAIRPHYLLHVVLHGKGEFFYPVSYTHLTLPTTERV